MRKVVENDKMRNFGIDDARKLKNVLCKGVIKLEDKELSQEKTSLMGITDVF